MKDIARRKELGKMLFDVAKYVATFVVIGGLFSERMDLLAVAMGIVLAVSVVGIGYSIFPPEE